MDAWVGIAAIIGATIGFVVVVLIGAQRRANRSPDVMAAMGKMLDMDYRPNESSIPWMGFRSLQRYGAFANVLDGRAEGIRVAAAQAMPMGGVGASVALELGDDPTAQVASEATVQRSVAMAFTRPLPAVVVVRSGVLNELADRLMPAGVDLELEAFNRAFHVRTDDPKDAYTVLQPQLMEWLLQTDERCSFETGATGVLVFASALSPEETPMLIATARGFAHRIPNSATLA